MSARASASILAAALACLTPQPQQSPGGNPAAISGVVVDAGTGTPVAGAVVSIRQALTALRQYTDSRGRFVFMGVRPDAPISLMAEKPGYEFGTYGQRFPGDGGAPPLRLTDGEWLRDVEVPLWRPSAIEGTVFDEQHEPIVGALVHALREFHIGGTTQYLPGPSVLTDDRGAYRAGRLSAGRYLVVVDSRAMTVPSELLAKAPFLDGLLNPQASIAIDHENGVLTRWLAKPMRHDGVGWWMYPTTYFPAAESPGLATAIELGSSETHVGADVLLEPVRTFRVSGVVNGPPEALVDLDVRALTVGSGKVGVSAEVASARVANDGHFEIAGVPAGTYTIEAGRRRTQFYTGGLTEGFTTIPTLPAIELSATISDVAVGPPGTMLLTTTSGSFALNWTGQTSVTVANHDVGSVSLPVREGARVSGRVVWEHSTGGAISQAVYFDSRDLSADTASTPARPGSDGTFAIAGLPPGRYLFGHRDAGTIKSVTWHGEDRTTQGFDLSAASSISDVVVTLTDNGAAVSGAVRDTTGGSVPAAVICFPVDPESWRDYGLHPHRLGAVVTNRDASYEVASLPEGDYFLVAVPPIDRERWQDAGFLAAASHVATRLTLHWGERVHADLSIRRIPPR